MLMSGWSSDVGSSDLLVIPYVSGLGLQPDLPRLVHAPDRIVLAAVLENQPRQALAHVTGLQQQIGDARITPIADRMERIAERHDHQSQQEASPRDRKVANEAVECLADFVQAGVERPPRMCAFGIAFASFDVKL